MTKGIETAIKKAIEGGYEHISNLSSTREYIYSLEKAFFAKYCLDPLFWQALGETEHWGEVCESCHNNISYCCEQAYFRNWRKIWHSFIDHLAEGKDINSYFEELLKDKEE